MTSQARARLVSEGVVASYIHDLSARAHTTVGRSRNDVAVANHHGGPRRSRIRPPGREICATHLAPG